MGEAVAISPLALDERGECMLWDERDRLVGKLNARTGRAIIGDAFWVVERTCRWMWLEGWSDTLDGRECDYANWALDCGCWDGWDRELYDFDDPCEPPRDWNFCPRCGAKVVG